MPEPQADTRSGDRGRLGALAERNFRLVFSSVTISALGDGVSTVALAFAVLHVSTATALGLVLAARQAGSAAIAVVAGVWADRLPRHLVLVAAASVQGVAQAVTGGLILTGQARVWMLVVLALVYGLADGFVIPTSQGLLPAVVSSTRLQQANALLGMSRSLLGVVGPALGGLLVAAGSPGSALLVDAATFALAALLLRSLAIAGRAAAVPEPFLRELREGWNAFRRQTWIWTTVVFFGIGNCASTSLFVLGPLVMKRHYAGATTWSVLLAAFSLGTIAGGLVALRIRPGRPLVASCVAAWPMLLQPIGIGLLLPAPVLVACSAIAGTGLGLHLALWFTTFQRNVPEQALSRVSSYDAMASFILLPVGSAIAGPVSQLIGVSTTLVSSGVVEAVCFALIIAQPSVWAIRDRPAVTA